MMKRNKIIAVLMLCAISGAYLNMYGCNQKETIGVDMKTLEAQSTDGGRREEIQTNDGEKTNTEIDEAASFEKTPAVVRDTDYFPPSYNEEDIPLSRIIVYYNSATGKDEETIGYLVEKGLDENTVWEDTVTGDIDFVCADENIAEFVLPNEKTISVDIHGENPVWEGYEGDVIEMLELDPEIYRVTQAKWCADAYEVGVELKRKAEYVVKDTRKGYYAVYEGIGYEIEESN